MRNDMRNDGTSQCLETTLTALLQAITDLTETDDEAFAVLEELLETRQISLVGEPTAYAA